MKTLFIDISPRPLSMSLTHNHEAWEILMNIEGSGIANVGDSQYDFYPGLIMCIPPNMYHSKIPNDKFRDIFLAIKDLPFRNDRPIIFTDDKDKTIETLIRTALRIYETKEKGYEVTIDHITSAICRILISKDERKPQSDSVELFRQKLIKNFSDPLFRSADIMHSTGYCADYFRRCFKCETGMSPVEYLNDLRIEHAKHLLSGKHYSKTSIADIAMRSGFSDARYFSKVFKKATGVTPHEYC